ncbi:MAG: hypothetical protein H7235_06405 [Bdellovibrionaceae bacterium]|nr:hypothetical protein [Pseudobdellovibrionaceae bacterium]
MTAALKRRELSEDDIIEAIKSMVMINNAVDYLNANQLAAIHSATDITGFGLSGHSMQLAKASGVTLKINAEALPKFSKTFQCLKKGFLTKAHRSNAEYTNTFINSSLLDTLYQQLIHDPQTSGGLLLAVDPRFSESILSSLKEKFHAAAIIGHVEALQDKVVIFD